MCRFKIWQAVRQQCCRNACQISERSDNSKHKSRGFEIWWDLTIGYRNGPRSWREHRTQGTFIVVYHGVCVRMYMVLALGWTNRLLIFVPFYKTIVDIYLSIYVYNIHFIVILYMCILYSVVVLYLTPGLHFTKEVGPNRHWNWNGALVN